MRSCSSKTILGIVSAIALVGMLALSVTSARAATLSGTIVDHSNYTHGSYFVYLVQLSLEQPVAGWAFRTTAGPWQIRNVPNGHYFVVAWRDVNGNFVPSRGEPMGFYGVPFPSRVTVQGPNISDLQVVLDATNLGAEVTGTVTYTGSLTGRIWVFPHVTPDIDLTTVMGTPFTMTTPGDYVSYIPDHGTYFMTAFLDVNGNMLRDRDEPATTVGPLEIVVTPGVTYPHVDIHLDDPVMAIEPTSWSAVKELFR